VRGNPFNPDVPMDSQMPQDLCQDDGGKQSYSPKYYVTLTEQWKLYDVFFNFSHDYQLNLPQSPHWMCRPVRWNFRLIFPSYRAIAFFYRHMTSSIHMDVSSYPKCQIENINATNFMYSIIRFI
jgi:hypothetical protein